MTRHIISFVGRFQWWSYTVSHGCLLLRRTKIDAQQTRIDVLFKDVKFVQLTTTCDNPEIVEDEAGDVPVARGSVDPDDHIYVIRARDASGIVVAGSVHWEETDREYHEPSGLLDGYRT